MSLSDAVAAELPFMRQTAESLMTDTLTAYSPNGTPTPNADGYLVDGFTDEGETPGKVSGPSVQSRDTNTRTVTIGGAERYVVDAGLHIPLSAPLPAIGWEYECTAVGPATDPGLLGRRFRVVDVPLKSLATARRLDVVDVTDAVGI